MPGLFALTTRTGLHRSRRLHPLRIFWHRERVLISVFIKHHWLVLVGHVRMHQVAIPVPFDVSGLAVDLSPSSLGRFGCCVGRLVLPIAEALKLLPESDRALVVDHVHTGIPQWIAGQGAVV